MLKKKVTLTYQVKLFFVDLFHTVMYFVFYDLRLPLRVIIYNVSALL